MKKVCFRCGTKVKIERDKGLKKEYKYYCSGCDENMYTFEVNEKETLIDKIIKRCNLMLKALKLSVYFETYADDDGYIIIFKVSKKWARKWIAENYEGMSLQEFRYEFYTYDDAERMYQDALYEKVVRREYLIDNDLFYAM